MSNNKFSDPKGQSSLSSFILPSSELDIPLPTIISHDPPISPTSSQFTTPSPTLSASNKNNNPMLSRLADLLRKNNQPPLRPTNLIVGKSPSAENANAFTFDNPTYGCRDDVFPSSLSAPNLQSAINLEQNDDENKSKKKDAHAKDENKVRGNWGSHIEFVLSCIGYAVGLGNVWRFPYLCYKNGGGSFLLIYWVLSVTVGFPIIFLELSLGQFTSQGPTGVWNYAPIVKGLGYSMCVISAIGSIYYNVIISWALYYLFASFRSHLLWTDCDYDSWANYRCELPKVACLDRNQLRATDGLCYSLEPFLIAGQQLPRFITTFCKQIDDFGTTSYVSCYYIVDEIGRNRTTVTGCWNERLAVEHNRSPQFSTEQFYFREVLGQVGSNYSAVSLGPPQKWLALSLLLAWILVFLCLLNGIKTSGKVVYFTALFPYAVLGVLIGRGVSLPGALNGIMYFLMPKFEKMQDPNVWYAAASQLFFSLSACWGGMMALSSYNKFHTNAFRDALIVTFADTITSFLASFAIFSVIGYGSYILNKPVDEVADAGSGLAFILYPKIIDTLPGSVAWAIMFFVMLLLLGLDTEFNGMETIFTAVLDKFPQYRSNLKKKALAFCIFCTPFFLLGLPLVCSGGSQLLELIDDYGPGWPVFLIGILETLSVAWIYGAPRFAKDLSAMMPFLLNGKIRAKVVPWTLRIFWGIITPSILIFIMIFSWTNYEPRKVVGEEILGWFITVGVIIWVPLTAIWVVVQEARRQKSVKLGFKSAFTRSQKWGPFLDEHRREVAAIHGEVIISPAISIDNSLDCVVDDSKNKRQGGGNIGGSFGGSFSGDGGGAILNGAGPFSSSSSSSIFRNLPSLQTSPLNQRFPEKQQLQQLQISRSKISIGSRSTDV